MQTLTERITATTERFRTDPGAAVSTPAVTASLINGRARLEAGPFNWEADLGPGLGGENMAPSPTAYLLGALAGCAVVFMRDTLAPQLGVELDDVRATASCRSDAAGLLGLDGHDPSLTDLRLTITVSSPDDPQRIDALFDAWKARCPIFLGLLNPNHVEVELERR